MCCKQRLSFFKKIIKRLFSGFGDKFSPTNEFELGGDGSMNKFVS